MKLKTTAFAILASVGMGVGYYRIRRQLLARWLKFSPALNEVKVQRNIAVETEGGIKLMTDFYTPKGSDGQKYPTILIRTPYGRGRDVPWPFGIMGTFISQRIAERGYIVVIQTVRGRFDSGGEFIPRQKERIDGLATLDWIQKQPWFNGQLATFGPSYLGFVQWAIADSPLIKAMVPLITSSRAYPVNYPDGVFDLDLALHWGYNISHTRDFEHQPRWKVTKSLGNKTTEQALTPAFLHLPVIEADKTGIGRPVTFIRDWLHEPSPTDEYWKKSDNSEIVPQVTAPVHLVSGWYDFMLRELLLDYQTLHELGRNPYLTIGPWFHSQPAGLLEGLRIGLTWFDAQLKGNKTALRTKPVRYYVMGADEWREADSWPLTFTPTRYFLQDKLKLSPQTPPAEATPDCYTYNPANPTPSLGGTLLSSFAGAKDNRQLEGRDDVLVYTTAPLQKAVEIIGAVKLELFVKSSLEHTDFYGRLCDVYPDGRSINICDGLLRIEPGKGELQPDGSLKIEVDLWATAQSFKPGHCIRLQVSSGAHPRWNRNLGTGEPIASAIQMRVAQQTIFHDASHPSALILPVVG